jgi:hypothetical protein
MKTLSMLTHALVLALALVSTARAGERHVAPAGSKRANDTKSFALVIGSNATLDADQAPLRFADDDAARITELFEELGADVELVTTFDRESQATHRQLVGRARSATPSGLQSAWESLRERMTTAKSAGKTVELTIFYSGHGDVGPDGQGYLTLNGGKLTRHDLFDGILAQSPADHQHVIIDACRSEHFVLSRGKDWKPDRSAADASTEVRRYLDRTHLGAFPNTGVVVAHSADQQTHEWERYRGGIFTHQLLSGLRGGADLNGDGRIEYSELGAFVSAANSSVDDPRARLTVVVRPPAHDERQPIVVHRELLAARVLLFLVPDASLYTLEDARGVRIADLRRTTEQPAYLRLPEGDLFVHRQAIEEPPMRQESRIGAAKAGVIIASRMSFEPAQGASRGALDQAFRRGLFATPFGPGYYTGYTDQNGLLTVDTRWQTEAWGEQVDAQPEPESSSPDASVQTEDSPDEEPPPKMAWWEEGRTWGGVFFGTAITPFAPSGRITGSPKRVTSNQFRACLVPRDPSGCSAMRGFDLRWQIFHTRPSRSKYPRTQWYFRTGYGSGYADFESPEGVPFEPGQATSLGYVAVPLFLGGNIYLFDNFPVRPYAGLGFGFDVLRLQYDRHMRDDRTNVSARIGFELHAGIEARITNYVSLTAEVLQLWSARKKLSGVPDFSNEGFTIITGVSVNFPLHEGKR